MRTLRGVCSLLIGWVLWGSALSAQTLTSADVTYEAFSRFWPANYSSAYLRALTHRYVDGQLRFLTLTHTGTLLEFAPSADAAAQTGVTRTWNLSAWTSDHSGIWWEASKQRLWLTTAQDYPVGDAVRYARVTLLGLGDAGAVTHLGTWQLGSIPEKRVYGGCQPSPVAGSAYVCGWGGYTSRVAQTGGASMGPTMYGLPEPTSQPSGSTLPVTTILDTASSRGYRLTSAVNWFDGGDNRQNPSTRPTFDPATAGGQWKMPVDGHGWFTWGDSYYNTGVVIPGRGYLAVASLCQGYCWYQSSTLAFDGRQFELHAWNQSALGAGPLTRPTSMVELTLPDGRTDVFHGNVPTRNVSGATFDAVAGKLYLLKCPAGVDNADWACRVYRFAVRSQVLVPAAPPVPPSVPAAPPVTPAATPIPGQVIALPAAAVPPAGAIKIVALEGVILYRIP